MRRRLLVLMWSNAVALIVAGLFAFYQLVIVIPEYELPYFNLREDHQRIRASSDVGDLQAQAHNLASDLDLVQHVAQKSAWLALTVLLIVSVILILNMIMYGRMRKMSAGDELASPHV